MDEAFWLAFVAGLLGATIRVGFQELRIWRLSVAVKNLQEQRLSDVRARAANKRFDTDAELQELAASIKKNPHASSFDKGDDKWAGIMDRG